MLRINAKKGEARRGAPAAGRLSQRHHEDASGMNRSLWAEEVGKYRKEASLCIDMNLQKSTWCSGNIFLLSTDPQVGLWFLRSFFNELVLFI